MYTRMCMWVYIYIYICIYIYIYDMHVTRTNATCLHAHICRLMAYILRQSMETPSEPVFKSSKFQRLFCCAKERVTRSPFSARRWHGRFVCLESWFTADILKTVRVFGFLVRWQSLCWDGESRYQNDGMKQNILNHDGLRKLSVCVCMYVCIYIYIYIYIYIKKYI